MNITDLLDKNISGKYYVLDTKQDGLNNVVTNSQLGDRNYIKYCYNLRKYAKLEEGSLFIYRQPKRYSKSKKFYFFGGGIIQSIKKIDNYGNVEAIISTGFSLENPIYETDSRLNLISWTSKKKKNGNWGHFWNQYGMNQITKDEFLSILGKEKIKLINCEDISLKGITSILEENTIIESSSENINDYQGIYKNNCVDQNEKKESQNRKVTHRKIDFNALNKRQKKLGTFGECLILKDEENKLLDKGISKPVEHVAITKGDGLGYDILSYDEYNNEIFIEVKTTKSNMIENFYLTAKELEICRDKKKQFKLYRVYNLNMSLKTYNVEVFDGEELLKIFDLVPVSYVAKKV